MEDFLSFAIAYTWSVSLSAFHTIARTKASPHGIKSASLKNNCNLCDGVNQTAKPCLFDFRYKRLSGNSPFVVKKSLFKSVEVLRCAASSAASLSDKGCTLIDLPLS